MKWTLLDIKVLIIKRDNPLEEPQITDWSLIAVTQSGYMSWLTNIVHWKKVVMEAGVSASFNTIKNTKFYIHGISPGWKKTEPTKRIIKVCAASIFRQILLGLQATQCQEDLWSPLF